MIILNLSRHNIICHISSFTFIYSNNFDYMVGYTTVRTFSGSPIIYSESISYLTVYSFSNSSIISYKFITYGIISHYSNSSVWRCKAITYRTIHYYFNSYTWRCKTITYRTIRHYSNSSRWRRKAVAYAMTCYIYSSFTLRCKANIYVTIRSFSNSSINLYPREDYEDRSENKLCRYDVITHLTNKEIMLKEAIEGNYEKSDWGNEKEERTISKDEAQKQLHQVREVRQEVDSDRYLTPASYYKAKDICEKNPSTFNSEPHSFPDYDGCGTPWDTEDEDSDDNNKGNSGSNLGGSSTAISSSSNSGVPSGFNFSNFLDYLLVMFFSFFAALSDYVEYINIFY